MFVDSLHDSSFRRRTSSFQGCSISDHVRRKSSKKYRFSNYTCTTHVTSRIMIRILIYIYIYIYVYIFCPFKWINHLFLLNAFSVHSSRWSRKCDSEQFQDDGDKWTYRCLDFRVRSDIVRQTTNLDHNHLISCVCMCAESSIHIELIPRHCWKWHDDEYMKR